MIDWLVEPGPLNPTLFVVNAPNGPDRYQRFVPQSMTPVGYCPFNTRLKFARSSNVTVCDPVIGVTDGTVVAVGSGVEVAAPGVLVAVGLPSVNVSGCSPAG